jgi:hypothetical protein
LRASEDNISSAAQGQIRNVIADLSFDLSPVLRHAHVELSGALGDRAMLPQPRPPLAVYELRLRLNQQFPRDDGVPDAISERHGHGFVLDPNPGGQVG